ncbi:unnamed protein product, partial [Aphanomyces euteiches]
VLYSFYIFLSALLSAKLASLTCNHFLIFLLFVKGYEPNKGSQIVLLTGKNFLSWRRETAIYIAGKGLEGHIDGSIEEPLELPQGAEVGPFVRNKASPTWQRWRQDNMKCVDKIRKRLSLEIPDDIGDATITAKELWDLLQSRYGRATGYARAMAMRDIYMCQMKSGKSVSHHLANVSRLHGAWLLVLNMDSKYTSMSLFQDINGTFGTRDVENLKMKIEDEERRHSDMRGGRRDHEQWRRNDHAL